MKIIILVLTTSLIAFFLGLSFPKQVEPPVVPETPKIQITTQLGAETCKPEAIEHIVRTDATYRTLEGLCIDPTQSEQDKSMCEEQQELVSRELANEIEENCN